MQLQKRVSLTLVPIISALVIILSLATWSFIYTQARQGEIERTRLSFEINLIDIKSTLIALETALDIVNEYQEIFNLILEKDVDFPEPALTSNFTNFGHQLNNRISGFELLFLTDSDLNLLTKISVHDLTNVSHNELTVSTEPSELIKTLHSQMEQHQETQGVMAFEMHGRIHFLISRVFSPHINEGSEISWNDENFVVSILIEPFKELGTYEKNDFIIEVTNPQTLQKIGKVKTSIIHTEVDQGDEISADTPLFNIKKVITPYYIRQKIQGFTLILIAISIALICSLYIIVIRVLNRQILSPIGRLEQKVGRSVRTGVVDFHPLVESNEIEALGNRYLDLMDQIYRLANIDSLTQLPNREQFLTTVANTLKHQPETEFAIFYLDLDRFKQVNDFYGHAEGDHLLTAFAKELEWAINDNLDNSSGRTALISRLAGDEFAVFIECNSLKQPLEEVAENLVNKLDQEFETQHGPLHLEVSIGVANYPQHATTAEDLVAASDEAMFEAKKRGRNRWEILSQDIVDQNNLKKSIQEAIEESIAEDLFYIVFQPIFSTQDLELVAAEVLLRSQHPTLTNVGTETFINIAETNGSIRRIDSLVVHLALEKLAKVRKDRPHFKFAINFSATELISPNFVERLHQSVLTAGLPASAIELEITETQMTEFGHQAMDTLEKLHSMGFTVSLDDFGTGYNSFAQLNSSFVSRLKIDKRFVDALGTDSRDSNMVNIILGTSKLYGLEVVAEGVETEKQLAYMQERNCDYVQGYLLYKPMNWDEFSELLKAD